MTEKEFQQQVIELARLVGFKVGHFRPARVRRGGKEVYETPVAADGAGFPDLCLAKHGRLIFAELKSDKGKQTSAQWDWMSVLCAGPAEYYLWRPKDWKLIEKVLCDGSNCEL